MNKILSFFTLFVMIVSIIASVSPSIKNQIKIVTGNHDHASSLIPIPDLKKQDRKLARQSDDAGRYSNANKHSVDVMGINFIK